MIKLAIFSVLFLFSVNADNLDKKYAEMRTNLGAYMAARQIVANIDIFSKEEILVAAELKLKESRSNWRKS